MSIMEKLFGPRMSETQQPKQQPLNPPPVPKQQPQNPTNNPAQNPPPPAPHQTAKTEANGVIPNQVQEDGLDKFKDLWAPETPDPNEQNQQTALSPDKILEAASKADFSRFIPQEALAKIEAGGPEASKALSEIVGKVAQQVYGHSSIATTKIVNAAIDQAREEFVKQIPGIIKRHSVQENLLKENPAFSSPAVSPVIDSLKSQLSAKFPKATSEELTTMAKEYLTGVAKAISPPPKSSTETTKPKEDWSDFLTAT